MFHINISVFAKKLCNVSIFPKCTLYVKLPYIIDKITEYVTSSSANDLWPGKVVDAIGLVTITHTYFILLFSLI